MSVLPRNKYPEETVKKILDVSLKLFLEKGFEQTTVLNIVENLGGLTRGAFYHHFKSKEEVLEAIFKNDFSNENHPFQKAKAAEVANGLERVKLASKLALVANIENEHQISMSNLAVTMISNPRFLAELLKANQETAEFLVPMIEEGMFDGSIKQGNAKIMADLLMLLMNFWVYPTIFPCGKEESLAKITLIKQIFIDMGFPVIDEELEDVFIRVFGLVIG